MVNPQVPDNVGSSHYETPLLPDQLPPQIESDHALEPISEGQNHSVVKEGMAFVALRGVSNFIWLGGTAASIAAQEKLGVPWEGAVASVATITTGIEYTLSGQGVKIFKSDKPDSIPAINTEQDRSVKRTVSAVLRDGVALGYSGWAGASSIVEVNNVLGLESHKTRRLAQSAFYGVNVAAWGLPVFRGTALEMYDAATENPAQGVFFGAIGAAVIYGGMHATKKAFRNYMSKRIARKNDVAEDHNNIVSS